jgi:hypothetical protein
MTKIFKKYKSYIDNAIPAYFSDEKFIECFGRVPKFRYETMTYCWDHVIKHNLKTIVELGTSRSFVDGRFDGCNSSDVHYWQPDNPEVWDWSAGCFTRVIGELIQETDIELVTLDLQQEHINRSMKMTENLKNIEYYVSSSEEFLNSVDGQIDFLYMDTGDVNPVEPTAILHLQESKILVENNLISDNGIILIDDVRNPSSKLSCDADYGKAKYSIPYLQENGFTIAMDEYQVVMIKS